MSVMHTARTLHLAMVVVPVGFHCEPRIGMRENVSLPRPELLRHGQGERRDANTRLFLALTEFDTQLVQLEDGGHTCVYLVETLLVLKTQT